MLMESALALVLAGSMQTAPMPLIETVPPMEVAAFVQQEPASDNATETLPTAEGEQAEPSVNVDVTLPAESVVTVEAIPQQVGGAVSALQDEIVISITPPAPAPPPPVPEKPKEPNDAQRFGTVLGTYTTSYSTRQTNRCTNIRLSAIAISGKILQPGETFSFNSVVGKRTAARGYKVANVYSGGKVEEGIGGGICQVSSTLFNAALLSNMQITSRTCHGLPVSYLPAGRDATVSWGGPEFKFKNPYAFPVKITAGYDSNQGRITCSILGASSASAPDVKIAVTKKDGKYITKRTVNGTVNYTTTSRYK